MALTPSTMLPLGTKAPEFSLRDTISGKIFSLRDFNSDKGTVVMFICNHCPYVLHIQDKLIELANDYQKKGIRFVAISSNDAENYPQDGPDKMKEHAIKNHFCFPYLYDETQEIAKAYHAACTPDLYLFDENLKCVYRGRFDDTSPGRKEGDVSGCDLKNAMDNLISKKPIDQHQFPSMGCNIKWKK